MGKRKLRRIVEREGKWVTTGTGKLPEIGYVGGGGGAQSVVIGRLAGHPSNKQINK